MLILPASQLSASAPRSWQPQHGVAAIERSEDNLSQQRLTDNALKAGAILKANNSAAAAGDMALDYATGEAAQALSSELGRFGTVRLQFNTDRRFRLDGSALDMLLPLYDSPHASLFTQWGIRNQDRRNTVNIGLGVRRQVDEWRYGANMFLDNDLTGRHRRLGLGAEAWTHYLKLSANGYVALSDWRQSRALADYDERPANGYDVRAEAWLPAYPQWGGTVMFEQYHGDEVALFSGRQRQKNPYALTAGVSYTPIPLVTLGGDQRFGKGGNDLGLNVQVNYRLGESWRAQTDPAAVAGRRSLAGHRHDLVERNNHLVLAYRKQELIHLALPQRHTGKTGERVRVAARVDAKYGLARIQWDSPALLAAGGTLLPADKESVMVVLPAYRNQNDGNRYTLNAIAYDRQGNASNQASAVMHVEPGGAVIAELAVLDNYALADGRAVNRVQARITGDDGGPMAGQTVNFTADNGAAVLVADVVTDNEGYAATAVVSNEPGNATIRATAEHANRDVDVIFIASPDAAILLDENLTVIRDNALADGRDTNEIQARVTDVRGRPLAGQTVSFGPGEGNPTVMATTVATDADGIARATLTHTVAGRAELTARVASGESVSRTVTFTAGRASRIMLDTVAHPSMQPINADKAMVADGGDSFYAVTARVTDDFGNAVAGAGVRLWGSDNGLKLSAAEGQSDQEGKFPITVSSVREGTFTLDAALADGTGRETTPVAFVVVDKPFYGVRNGSDYVYFPIDFGFPQTAFAGARFSIYPVTGTDDLASFDWSSTDPGAVSVNNGIVTFLRRPEADVVIEARKAGYHFYYSMSVVKWFTWPAGAPAQDYAGAVAACSALGMRLPRQDGAARDLAGDGRGQTGGALRSEWGPLSHYGFDVSRRYWTQSPSQSLMVTVDLEGGTTSGSTATSSLSYVCINAG
ncbi:inverse autotransporter beta domain-containing protein [Martelella alba]|nr:inverse autotransporter beta domain-containing protein [Martelella alba]